jgi:hypothetical protein
MKKLTLSFYFKSLYRTYWSSQTKSDNKQMDRGTSQKHCSHHNVCIGSYTIQGISISELLILTGILLNTVPQNKCDK